MKILALDTATENLSVALYADGQLCLRESRPVRGHGEWLLPMVDEVLAEAGVVLGALDAIAVGRGPGAFTGVRIAVSVAQGLAFATGLPIVGVSDLAALALGAAQATVAAGETPAPLMILSCLDARLGGLYAAAFRLPAGTVALADPRHYLNPVEALVTPAALELPGEEPIKFGITKELGSNNPFTIWAFEFKYLLRDLFYAPGLKAKMTVLFGKPGETYEHRGAKAITGSAKADAALIAAE